MAEAKLYDTLEKTALDHMHACESPHPWSFEHIWQYRTEDCVHYLYPNALLPAPFNKGLAKDGFQSAMKFFGSVMDSTHFELHDMCVDTKKRTVMMRVTAHMDLKAVPGEGSDGEEAVQDWQAQYMWLNHMNESGNKIRRIDEFMDAERLMAHVKARAEKMMAVQSKQ